MLTSAVAQARTTVYIDKDLYGDCPGTYDPAERGCGDGRDTAYESITSALEVARPGTRFILRGGEYREVLHLTVSGTAGSPIVWEGAKGESVVIGDVDAIVDDEEYGPIWLDGVRYNELRGITVTDSVGFLRAIDAHHNIIERNTFNRSNLYPSQSKRGGLYFGFSSHNKLINNRILKGTDSLALVHSDFNVIQANTLTVSGHELLTMKCSSNNVVRGNRFSNPEQKLMAAFDCEKPTMAWVGNGRLASENEVLDRNHRNLIEYNQFAESSSYYSTSGGNGIQYAGQNGIIRFNTFHDENVGLGMTYYDREAMFNRSNRVYNNTFYNNRCGGISLMGAQEQTRSNIRDNQYANNLLWDNKGWGEDGTSCEGTSPGQIVWRNSFSGHQFRGNAIGSPRQQGAAQRVRSR
ncbi:MAG: right-handed parallel beta-helix repeat-containing protein [Pseudomonadales bacterium]